jgi:hypothetical protein
LVNRQTGYHGAVQEKGKEPVCKKADEQRYSN